MPTLATLLWVNDNVSALETVNGFHIFEIVLKLPCTGYSKRAVHRSIPFGHEYWLIGKV